MPQSNLYSLAEGGLLAVETLRVDPEQNLCRVTGPLRDRGQRHSAVEPRGDGGVPEVVGGGGERARRHLGYEHLSPRSLPCPDDGQLRQFGVVALAVEQPAVRRGPERVQVLTQEGREL